MNTSIKIAFVAAVTLMVTLLGLNLVPRSGGVGAELPTPSPTASPSPAPTLPPSGELAPGTYRADYLTYTVPAGWNSSEGWATYKDPTEGALLVSPWGPFLTVYSDPCNWQSTGAAVGPTVDDEVAALVAQHRGATVTPIDVTVDGFSGKELDLMVPLDATIASCDGGKYKVWTDRGGDRFNQGPGQHDLLDILDAGGTTVAIDRVYWPGTTAADRAEQQAIFDSIIITPPAPTPTAAPTP